MLFLFFFFFFSSIDLCPSLFGKYNLLSGLLNTAEIDFAIFI